MADRPALTVRPAREQGQALALLERASPHEVTGAARVADLVDGCALFDLVDAEGRAIGAFAVRVDQYSTGRELTVTAAGGQGDHGATEAMAAWCERQARGPIGARVVTCQTRRRGLVRKLQRAGWCVAGYVMSKEI